MRPSAAIATRQSSFRKTTSSPDPLAACCRNCAVRRGFGEFLAEAKLAKDSEKHCFPIRLIGGVHPEGFEPPTPGSEDRCSVQLSYGCLVVFFDALNATQVLREHIPSRILLQPVAHLLVQLVVTVYVTEIRNRCNCCEGRF